MIVAYDVSHIQRRRGGIGRFSLSLLQQLLRVDDRNRYILHGWSYSIDQKTLEGLRSPRCALATTKIPGPVKRAYWERLPIVPLRYFAGEFDLFHSSDPFYPPVGRRKVIVTVYDLLSRSHPQYFEPSIVKRDRRMVRWAERADAVLVPSRFTLEELSRSGIVPAERIHVVPPPIADTFSAEEGPLDGETVHRLGLERPYILFVGTLEPRKNVAGLVKAFERLCADGMTGVDLVIAGKLGWMSTDVPRAIHASPRAGRIHWLRYVPESDLAPLYRRAVCFVYPSFVEGYGLPVAESMACGVPVITSNSSGMKEAAGAGALLVDPSSTADIASAMAAMIGDGALRERYAGAAVHRAKSIRDASDPRSVIRIYESLGQQ